MLMLRNSTPKCEKGSDFVDRTVNVLPFSSEIIYEASRLGECHLHEWENLRVR